MPRPSDDPSDEGLDATRYCPFRADGCLQRADGYRALLTHIHAHHPGRWPRAERDALTKVRPWPDASEGCDLDTLDIDALTALWTRLEADALHAAAAGFTVPPPSRPPALKPVSPSDAHRDPLPSSR
jgi:hypothetical protein